MLHAHGIRLQLDAQITICALMIRLSQTAKAMLDDWLCKTSRHLVLTTECLPSPDLCEASLPDRRKLPGRNLQKDHALDFQMEFRCV